MDTVLRGRAVAPEVRDEEREMIPVPAAMKEELSTLNSGFNDPDITSNVTSSSPFLKKDEDNYSYFDSLANEEM
jgi:hypothetical protein